MSTHGLKDAVVRPLHWILLAFPIALFTFALFTDIAYLKTAEVQWTNFSAWLISVGVIVLLGKNCPVNGFLIGVLNTPPLSASVGTRVRRVSP